MEALRGIMKMSQEKESIFENGSVQSTKQYELLTEITAYVDKEIEMDQKSKVSLTKPTMILSTITAKPMTIIKTYSWTENLRTDTYIMKTFYL